MLGGQISRSSSVYPIHPSIHAMLGVDSVTQLHHPPTQVHHHHPLKTLHNSVMMMDEQQPSYKGEGSILVTYLVNPPMSLSHYLVSG
jgi:hypothetical protein